jgi:hypothetical protein
VGRLLRADPTYRRRVLVKYSLFTALSFVLVFALQQWGKPAFDRYLEGQNPDDALRLLKALLLLVMFLPLGMCVYLFRLGRRIKVSGQLPPPGTRVLHDTVILEGRAAVWRGTAMVTLSVVLGLAVVAAAIGFALL